MRLAIVVLQVQLYLQVVRYKSRYWLLAEDVLHGAVLRRFTVMVRVNAVLVIGEQRDELH
jgi:hypothetical protein